MTPWLVGGHGALAVATSSAGVFFLLFATVAALGLKVGMEVRRALEARPFSDDGVSAVAGPPPDQPGPPGEQPPGSLADGASGSDVDPRDQPEPEHEPETEREPEHEGAGSVPEDTEPGVAVPAAAVVMRGSDAGAPQPSWGDEGPPRAHAR